MVSNTLTNKASFPKQQVNFSISVEQLNSHFSTVAEKIITKHSTSNNTLDKLQEFCQSRNSQIKLVISVLTVTDVYNTLKHLKQSGTLDLDGLDTKILKLDTTHIADTLTYVYNLCIIKQTLFLVLLKRQRSFLCTNLVTVQTLQTIDQFPLYLSFSKPLEKHINKHLLLHLNSYYLLHPSQSGFRKKTTHAKLHLQVLFNSGLPT